MEALPLTDAFPAAFGLTPPQTRRALESACRAPSLHNSQPWAFRVTGERIELHLDRDRLLPVSDPDDREARIGAGAALFNLRLALIAGGVQPAVSVLPDGDRGPLAVLRRQGHTVGTPELRDLYEAIPQRRTNRRPFLTAEVPSGHQRMLVAAVEREGATVHLVTAPDQESHLQRLASAAFRTQSADPAWLAEWAAWTGRTGSADGVPVTAAGPPPAPQDRWTLRDFGAAGRPERIDGKDFEDQPLVAVVATHHDSAFSQLQAGQAMQRLLLAATIRGLSASFVSQLVEVPSARRQLRTLVGGYSHPQVVLRIGFGGPVTSTPRRPVTDCLLPAEAEAQAEAEADAAAAAPAD